MKRRDRPALRLCAASYAHTAARWASSRIALSASGPCVAVPEIGALRAQGACWKCDGGRAKRRFWLFLNGGQPPTKEQPKLPFCPPSFPSLKKAQNEKPKQGGCLATHGPIAASPPPETSKREVSSQNMPPGVACWPLACLAEIHGVRLACFASGTFSLVADVVICVAKLRFLSHAPKNRPKRCGDGARIFWA